MALFTNLSNLQYNVISYGYTRPNGQRNQIYPFTGQVLGKISCGDIQPQLPHLFDALRCQQAYLTVSAAIGMGIADKPKFFPESAFSEHFLSRALFLTAANGNYASHNAIPP
jgi:hypothetical protein